MARARAEHPDECVIGTLFCPVYGRCVDAAGVFPICHYCPVVACRNHGLSPPVPADTVRLTA